MVGRLSNWIKDDITKIVTKEVSKEVSKQIAFTKPEKIRDHFYTMTFSELDYDYGMKYGKIFKGEGACSVVRKGNFVGRNFDWYYTDNVQVLVKTQSTEGRFATIGMSMTNGSLTDEVFNRGEYQEEFKIVPFLTVDTINENGVQTSINVITHDKEYGLTTGTNPNGEDLCAMMIPRYVGDFAKTAEHGVELLKGRNIFALKDYPGHKNINEEIHIMISDKNNTYLIEIIKNELKIYKNEEIPGGKSIMTNFYLYNWNGEIKTHYNGYSEEEVKLTGLREYSMGLERYQILRDGYEGINSELTMLSEMSAAKYTQSYTIDDPNNKWYSEFVGKYDEYGKLDIYSSTKEDFAKIMQDCKEQYNKHERDNFTWYTDHTSIYNIEQKTIDVCIEEDYNKVYRFRLDIPGYEEYVDEIKVKELAKEILDENFVDKLNENNIKSRDIII